MKRKKPLIKPNTSNTRIIKHSMSKRFSSFSGVPLETSPQKMPHRLNTNLGLNSLTLRHQMVQRVKKQGITDDRVLDALMSVPRHLFLDQALASHAYEGTALPIGFGQTISQSYIVAKMVSILLNNPNFEVKKVLEIGTGCGYQSAVLAELFDEVHSIERIKGLYDLALENLKHAAGGDKISINYGDGMLGLPNEAPFDGIVLAAAGLTVPKRLLLQLRVGGFLVAPQGDEKQHLILIYRQSQYEFKEQVLEPVSFVPLLAGTQT
ncbi:MAG: protein-L-isoaspartate(D-aspartate) O-methyltransferase [Alcaligenaceae bacterium]|nr:protein-L-isoaspartate(D-aspartate) O-methyltransferase [Alcaligenaceae bacterium]